MVSGTKPRCHNGIDDNEEVLGLLYLVVAYLLAFLDCTGSDLCSGAPEP